MTLFPVSRRTTAASLLLAAVVSFPGPTGCGSGSRPPETGHTTPTTPVGPDELESSDGHFTLAIQPETDDPTRIVIVVSSVDSAFGKENSDRLEGLIEVRAEAPLLGSIERVSDREIRFAPSFPLLAGQDYVVRFLPQLGHDLAGDTLECHYRVPAREAAPAPTVTALYPTSAVLPANHLKFYIVFSEPMQLGEIWDYFRLDDLDNDRPVPRPFRHTELWSRDRRTLTLWFHPGRVKQGVNLNVELGAILTEGRRYRLSISGDWPSARGTPLGTAVTREFTAGPTDHQQPDLAKWKITVPAARSSSALVCGLGSSHDWALLHSDVRVETAAGQPVAGAIETTDHESTWTFTPQSSWQPGRYRLAVGSVLEDLAGNSLERPFEVDITDRKSPGSTPAGTRYREFTIQP